MHIENITLLGLITVSETITSPTISQNSKLRGMRKKSKGHWWLLKYELLWMTMYLVQPKLNRFTAALIIQTFKEENRQDNGIY